MDPLACRQIRLCRLRRRYALFYSGLAEPRHKAYMDIHFPPHLQAQIDRMRRNGLGDLLWRSAARTPHKTAIVYKELRQSFAELDETVNRVANALALRGVCKDERVALLSHNNPSWCCISPWRGWARSWCRSTSCSPQSKSATSWVTPRRKD
ncbi:protein of unknown function [Denitratisoma oestradiolicum]|uniref:AMP-dependent synthetase/ligase domain-containing protein n=1 Tax=Denitratisoma oestradiolicum TaxID=311182 RepID=A0A6S6XYJ0_9PROT|nr:protein of unknown function [Denitratisoma oestradiolicum]